MMGGDRLRVQSIGAVPLETIRDIGVRTTPDVNALATRTGRDLAILVWNYHDDDTPAPPASVEVIVSGAVEGRPTLTHYRVDLDLSNSYEAWKKMGSPQQPSATHRAELEKAGKLQMLGPPQRLRPARGELRLKFVLPRQGVSLLRLVH
jgi:xylan 1,4-beta-xylosidase